MNTIPDGAYLRDNETGEHRPIALQCDPSDAIVPDGCTLLLRVGGEWMVFEKRAPPDPLLMRLDDLIEALHELRDELGERGL